jgi:hypothetical protein
MNTRSTIAGMTITKLVSLSGFLIGFMTIWIHLEISIAQINVDLANLKQDMIMHKSDNRKDMETLRIENAGNTREILMKVDEIQIYLRNNKKW